MRWSVQLGGAERRAKSEEFVLIVRDQDTTKKCTVLPPHLLVVLLRYTKNVGALMERIIFSPSLIDLILLLDDQTLFSFAL